MNRFGGERVVYSPPGTVPYVPDYWERLWTDTAFQQALQCRWKDLRNGPLQMDALNRQVDGWLEQIKVALPRDAAMTLRVYAHVLSDQAASTAAVFGRLMDGSDAA